MSGRVLAACAAAVVVGTASARGAAPRAGGTVAPSTPARAALPAIGGAPAPGLRTLPQFSPAGGGSYAYTPGTLQVTITWCAEEPLLPGSRAIRLNGTDVTGSFTYQTLGGTQPCFDEGMALARSVGTVALQEGVNHLVASICSEVQCATDSAAYVRLSPPDPAPTASVRVSPDTVAVTTAAFAVDTQRFVVKSLATATRTFAVQATCDRIATSSCVLSASTVTLAAAESAFVDLVYTAGPVGASGPLRLRAHRDTDPHDQDDGSARLSVTTGAPGALRVRVAEAQRTTAVAKDLCLSAAITRETSVVCGDLQVVHPLPAITVRNRARQPLLLYDSRTASGTALLAAAVTLPAGATPDSVTATLSVRSTGGTWATATTGRWAGGAFAPGVAARIALAWEMAGDVTRLVPYRLDVRAWDGATPRTTVRDSGAFAFVNRSASPFGAGWWLAGLDGLYAATGAAPSASDTTLLWVGGDGSTRRFRSIGSQTWVGDTVDVRETIRWISDSAFFERRLPNGVRVRFDGAGRHTHTLSPQGIATRFTYDGAGRLASILPAGLATATHALSYVSGTGVIICAQGPCTSATTRRDTLFLSAGTLASISGVGGRVEFTGDALRRITARRDRRGTLTRFAYVGRAGLLDTATTDSAGTDWRRLRFQHGQGAGLGSPSAQVTAAALLEVATWMDGPRSDVGDTTRVWLDPFGAPRRVRDALGHATTVSRGDRRFPALVTETRAADAFTTWAMYDAHGNLAVHGAEAPYGDSRNPRTTYAWDTTWAVVTRTTQPAGDWNGAAYDSATGLRTAVFGMRGDTTRVTYVTGSGIDRALVQQVQQPYGIVERYRYDTLGNLDSLVAPDSAVTVIVRDALGRDTLRLEPILGSLVERIRTTYDARDRVTDVARIGAAVRYALRTAPSDSVTVAAETLTVAHTYDAESNLTASVTYASGQEFPTVTETNAYDLAHGLLQRTSAGATTTYTRDRAGNVVASLLPGETEAVRWTFDARNREVTRITPEKVHAKSTCTGYQTGPLNGATCQMVFPIIPNDTGGSYRVRADTATFTYDAVGRRLSAVNRTVALRWSYYPGGAVRTDSTGTVGVRLRYDWNGRRVAVALGSDSLWYGYHPYGALRRVTLPGNGFFRFTYDSLFRLDSMLVRPAGPTGGLVETRAYDERSRLKVRVRTSLTLGGLNHDTLLYDARDRLRDVRSASRAAGANARITLTYGGLGAVVAQERTRSVGAPTIEQFTTDAAGTVLAQRTRSAAAPRDTGWFGSAFGVGGRLVGRGYLDPPPDSTWSTGQLYSDDTEQFAGTDGRVRRSGRVEQRIASDGGNPPQPVPAFSRQEATRNFFGADGRLAATQRYVWTPSGRAGTWEAYEYDALGRRHRVVVNRDSTSLCQATAAWCHSYTETTVWDGDAVLQESRGGSPRRMVPGLQLDQPLALWDGRVFNPSWRGALESSVWMTGAAADQTLGTGTGTIVDWAEARGVYWTPGPGSGDALPPDYTWVGSAATGGVQTTGQMYRRNRQYDPLSGQFTQPDPIGLAGGLNLYGYAGGDPINFSDPFGLCPQEKTGRPCKGPLGDSPHDLRDDGSNPRVGEFGKVRNGGTRAHQGNDYKALKGQGVYAADDGTVSAAGFSDTYGNYIELAHKNGAGDVVSYTFYAHLQSSTSLSVGDAVSGGQGIGGVGRTGNLDPSIPTHLHFEIRTRSMPGLGLGGRLDPAPHIKPDNRP